MLQICNSSAKASFVGRTLLDLTCNASDLQWQYNEKATMSWQMLRLFYDNPMTAIQHTEGLFIES